MEQDLRGREYFGYKIVRLLGEGGFASVWLAVDQSRKVAVKVLLPELVNDPKVLKRFRDEAEFQQELRHPNLVRVEGYSTKPPVILMEYVEGRALSDMIGQEVGPIPLMRAHHLMRQILWAVGHAHSKNVLHRDLKPANIIVTPHDVAKVMDFGIAKVMGGARSTRTGYKIGTPAYMSPEQIKGACDVDARSDIYSLGVTFYEMLAGRLPFEEGADGVYDVYKGHVELVPPNPQDFYPAIPDAVVWVLMIALEKGPDLRYQTVADMGRALEAAVERARVEAHWASAAGSPGNVVAPTLVEGPTSQEDTYPASSSGQEELSTPVEMETEERKKGKKGKNKKEEKKGKNKKEEKKKENKKEEKKKEKKKEKKEKEDREAAAREKKERESQMLAARVEARKKNAIWAIRFVVIVGVIVISVVAAMTVLPDSPTPVSTAEPKAPDVEPGPVEEDRLVALNTISGVATFTTTGAALRQWEMFAPRYLRRSKDRVVGQPLVPREGHGPWPLATELTIRKEGFKLSSNTEYTVTRRTADTVRFVHLGRTLLVTKEYRLDPQLPLIHFTLRLRNLTSTVKAPILRLSLFGWAENTFNSEEGVAGLYPRDPMVICQDGAGSHRRDVAALGGEGERSFASDRLDTNWIGAGDRYFLTALAPLKGAGNRECQLTNTKDGKAVLHAALSYTNISLNPGEEGVWQFVVYAGPRTTGSQGAAWDALGGVDLSSSPAFDWLTPYCLPVHWALRTIHQVAGGATCVIVLALVIWLLTLYFNHKILCNMARRCAILPEVDSLCVKFNDDDHQLKRELITLHKAHKVNPWVGWWFVVIQAPILLAVHHALGSTAELFSSPLWMGWIPDLTNPDPYYMLPMLVGCALCIQQLLLPRPAETVMAKAIMWFMPWLVALIMVDLASGLALFLLAYTVPGIFHNAVFPKEEPTSPVRTTD